MILLLLLAGCVTTTGGERVTFDAVSVPLAPIDTSGADPVIAYDDTDTGWHVVLTEARVAVGPAYLWSGEPLLSTTSWSPLDWAFPPAWADIDHFEYGYQRGEVLEQVAVDLLGGEVPVGPGEGLAGDARSAELWLAPPVDGVDLTDTIVVRGTATLDALVVPFAGALTIDDDVLDVEGGQTATEQRKVRGIPLDAQVDDGGTLVIGVDARLLLAGVDFSDLLAQVPDGDGVYTIAPGTGAWGVFYYQVRQSGEGGPWRLSWRP